MTAKRPWDFPTASREDIKLGRVKMDCDICSECGEHTEFEETDGGGASSCCGAKPYDTDPDVDMER